MAYETIIGTFVVGFIAGVIVALKFRKKSIPTMDDAVQYLESKGYHVDLEHMRKKKQ